MLDWPAFEPARLEERRIAFLLRRHDEVRDETIQVYAEPLRAALGRPPGGPFSDEAKAGSQGEPDSGKNPGGDEQATAT